MIISKTPFRVSFLGGGTDLKSYYKENSGSVISTSIDKYIYLSMHNYFYPSRYLLKYSQTEEVGSIGEIKHNIIREVFRKFDIKNIDFNSTADIPSGTGMGSSSAFTVGLINLCSAYSGMELPQNEIARLACEIEIDVLKDPIGKQDQYGTAIGGFKRITFNPNESVDIAPIYLNQHKLKELQNNLLLFYTNHTRSAASILSEQKMNIVSSQKVVENLRKMSELADHLFLDLKNQNIDYFGNYLHESWQYKKELASKISNEGIDELYDIGIKNGATGGKLLGAGGSGFILFYAPEDKHMQIKRALGSCQELPFNFEEEGTKIIFRN